MGNFLYEKGHIMLDYTSDEEHIKELENEVHNLKRDNSLLREILKRKDCTECMKDTQRVLTTMQTQLNKKDELLQKMHVLSPTYFCAKCSSEIKLQNEKALHVKENQ